MATRSQTGPMIVGEARIRSHFLSSTWSIESGDTTLARMRRHGRMHVSTVELEGGSRWLLEPDGWGSVRLLGPGETEIGRITRRSWLGRLWEVTGPQMAYNLVSRPRPRRWYVGVGGAPIAEIHGSPISYNRIRIEASIGVPLAVVILGWHVIVRPWEAAAAPSVLVPVGPPDDEPERRR